MAAAEAERHPIDVVEGTAQLREPVAQGIPRASEDAVRGFRHQHRNIRGRGAGEEHERAEEENGVCEPLQAHRGNSMLERAASKTTWAPTHGRAPGGRWRQGPYGLRRVGGGPPPRLPEPEEQLSCYCQDGGLESADSFRLHLPPAG